MTTTTIQQDLYPTRTGEVPGPAFEREHQTVWGSAADGPFDADALEEHEKRGFTILQDFITGDEIELYSAELRRLSSDDSLTGDPRLITEKSTGDVRSVFEVTKLSQAIDALSRDPRVLDRARQLLGSEVYLHQTRVNYMPGFKGSGFYWHSDFETWHAEDGMPLPRAVSCSIALTPNYPFNGGLMVMPGSHQTYAPGVGETPADNHTSSLKEQTVGVPSQEAVTQMAHRYGIDQFTGPAGSALWFDSNIMHGSGNNITPFPRSNVFMVFNSVENALVEPYAAPAPRPEHIASRDFTPLS
ncbi:ectoine hydroxylase [Ruania alkalisoli]|uniref:Ectoine hydroxylase n=1 Tax=Ruania alkalisoli TaxID=2779775 RepID=A0A7M1SY50_9MICO|nr:ectoine hydroxylase [Ruania alkalisoli]QOR71967.1 ectoine hydroxylase [Ruania alkalisoli]